jgi:TolA-binding protein
MIEIISLILNFLLASGLAGTLIFYRSKRRTADAQADGAEIENTDRIVKMQSEHIGRLDQRVEKLEEKVDKLEIIIEQKDTQIEQKQCIIRQAYKCKIPNEECPVLIKRAEVERKTKERKNG